ncbi:hypothetical protein [Flavilitoribacter nigricans]|uniref:Uncharacterized protein n=1 Tax=Flavilitoribacter nigricans (strain ATCC 23147 / DSM 23189 / NBRC 102662 / NCIMB 1420 / SS-2) TaxID=1122177 RepID=A0A2D0NEW7_FLAN2|nr:hypothetical protein [Flavilitoribacter nigricans]PHN06948.1 hypothetical protein CRP01_09030 [Flavilitoribacter nigricans DSM 23189 = NBRC 102662]
MKSEDLYIAYFKHQAVNHPDILHQDVDGQKAFETVDIDEGLDQQRTQVKIGGYLLQLFHYTYRIGQSSSTGEVRKFIQGGFKIARHYEPRADGQDGYNEALRDAERVTDEVLEKMFADSINGHPLFYWSLNVDQDISVTTEPRYSNGSYAAKVCIFSFSQHWRNCITHDDAPAWLDGGETPNDLL